MVFLRAVIFTTLAMFLAVFAFFFFTFDSDYQLENALNSFLKDEYEDVSIALDHLEGEVSPSKLALYRAYLYREQGLIEKSDGMLELSLSGAERNNKADYLLEIQLNRAFNAYLDLNDETLSEILKEIRVEDSEHQLTRFFAGLTFYLNEEFTKALAVWKTLGKLEYLSGWMEDSFGKVFTTSWQHLRVAHCYIEEGKYLQGRKPLEKGHQQLSGEERSESAFLIGLSYAKEAESKPLVAAMPYYQVAHSYFQEVPIHHKRFSRERVRIVRQLKEAAEAFIEQKNLEHMSFFVNILENWKASEELEYLSNSILELLDREVQAGNWGFVEELANVLNRLLKSGKIRENLSERFETLTADLLEKGDLIKLPHYWQVSLLLSANPSELTEKTSAEIARKVLDTLVVDGQDLKLATPYVSYWSTIERDAQKRFLFSKQLVLVSAELWSRKGLEEKALNLMKLAETIPYLSERNKIYRLIAYELKITYSLAAQEDDIDKLGILYDAAKHFHIDSFGPEEKVELGNQLEDAAYLMKMGRFLEAQKRLAWILKVNQDHQQARHLMGMVAYQQGNYADALEFLDLLTDKDKEIQEVIAICQMGTGEEELGKKNLAKLAKQRPLSDHGYLQLGYVDLMQKEPRESLKWLRNIRRPDGEAIAYLGIASFQLGEWKAALDYFHQLPEPFSRVFALKSIAVRSFLELDKSDLAEELLTRMLEDKEPAIHYFPTRFQKLTTAIIDQTDPKILAGKFYLEIKPNYQKALTFFNSIEEPSPEVLLYKGKAHSNLGHFKKSQWLLKQLAEQKEDDENRRLAIPLLAELYSLEQRFDQALVWYEVYFSEGGKDTEARLHFAKAYAGMMDWQSAVKQYQKVMESGDLSHAEELVYINSLFNSGDVQTASELIKKISLEGESLLTLTRIKLLRLALKVNAHEVFKEVLDTVGDAKDLTVLEKQELISLYVDLGKYNRARELAVAISDKLQQGIGGLMVLATLNERLSNYDEALSFARKAFSINPYDRNTIEFINNHDMDLRAIQGYLGVYRKEIEESGENLPAKIGYGRTLLTQVLSAKKQKTISKEKFSDRLQKVREKLQALSEAHTNYPEIFYLLGKTLYYLGDDMGAQHSLQIALNLNPSYVEAHKLLSVSFMKAGEEHKAMKSLEKALGYARDDVESWVMLANLHIKMNDVTKVRGSLEQARRFSHTGSQTYRILNNILLDIPSPSEIHDKETVQLLSENMEALKELLRNL
ncbi:MAG: tetratricopeptide (TPR) repeat protein [Chlamydiales bacterium]|jgi:tetratricopeptide (TPR) repeat protein